MQAQHLKALGSLTCFKAYDIPCQFGAEINDNIAYRTGRAYAELNPTLDTTNGISMDFGNWRMNNRASNTGPLFRLNIEAIGYVVKVQSQLQTLNQLLAH